MIILLVVRLTIVSLLLRMSTVGGTTKRVEAKLDNKLQVLLVTALKEKGLSLRQASKTIGISTTTLSRIANGESYDMDTMLKICKWLGTTPSSILDMEAGKLAPTIAAMIETYPELADVFSNAVKKILRGEVPPETISEIANYIAFRAK